MRGGVFSGEAVALDPEEHLRLVREAPAMAGQNLSAEVGERAGSLYLWNTVGAVAGSLLTGFLLLPALGMQGAVLALAATAALAIVPLMRGERLAPGAFLTCVVPLAMWVQLPEGKLAESMFTTRRATETVLTTSEGVGISIAITEESNTGLRVLYTNGHSMTSTRAADQRYMRAFVHLPLLMSEAPKRVVIICFGVGNTAHAASLHEALDVVQVVDLSADVFAHAEWFERWNHGVLDHPKVKAYVNDGRQHLRALDEPVDLITLEPPPLGQPGVDSLYSVEFYELAKAKLKDGGWMSQWLPAYQVDPEVGNALVAAFMEVFPDGVLLNGYGAEFILLARKGGPVVLDPKAFEARLATEPAVRADLEQVNLATMLEIAGTFAGAPATLKDAVEGVLPITDDLPIMEYTAHHGRHHGFGDQWFDLAGFEAFCPTCATTPGLEPLPAYLAYLHELYHDARFLKAQAPRILRPAFAGDPKLLKAAWDRSRYLRTFFPYPPPLE